MLEDKDLKEFRSYIESSLPSLCRKPTGWMKHPYICLGGHYGEGGRTFFWDSFFMALRMCRGNFNEEIRGTLECYLDHMDSGTGKVLRIISPSGPLAFPSQDQIQPFLCQLAYLANMNKPLGRDAERILEQLSAFLDFWQRDRGTTLGLSRWLDSYESGLDCGLGLSLFGPLSVAAVDLNSYLVLECRAAAALAKEYGQADRAAVFQERAKAIAEAILKHMWDPEHEIFCNIDMLTGRRIFLTHADENFCVIPWTNFTPLYAGIATRDQAEATTRRYLLSPEHMRCRFGLRSFSKKSVYYTEQRVCPVRSEIVAYYQKTGSNWNGPVWTLSNYFMAHGMSSYGFRQEAYEIALDVAEVNWRSVQREGGMFENYHPETGKGLWAKDLFSWNILADVLSEEIKADSHPLKAIRTKQSY